MREEPLAFRLNGCIRCEVRGLCDPPGCFNCHTWRREHSLRCQADWGASRERVAPRLQSGEPGISCIPFSRPAPGCLTSAANLLARVPGLNLSTAQKAAVF